ncbi:MAG: GyrI-like domain-containing protein [Candidatus Eisenbacteria bacterium]|uniref:GyrI-like domain-containing protein n=1 Tax=Eiseniibacteriota bacterium TaxID=2212470 RepID=A0A948RUX0_UNCEI|nr:GyrI-like domain-containing protein [Candidatus Eisenbacteria bacterium]MBU1950765.1 GyrI-like domain-containing protein [Candidatus Eisenbacteria bacterium]MBU2690149.1 GyrI-like domain-containing protein [Candidatus Eisenbacteria bacterium]
MRTPHCSTLFNVVLVLFFLCAATGLAADAPPDQPPGEKSEVVVMPNSMSEIKAETLPAMTLVALSMSGSYEQHGAAIGKLMMYTGMSGFQMTGGPFGIYLNSPEEVAEDSLLWQVCVPVAGVTAVEKPYELIEMPEMLAAYGICTGPIETTDPCYGVLFEWIAKNSYETAGPLQEHWLTDDRTTPPEENKTKIVIPVVKK